MSETFGGEYADAYDAMYADKDYAAECDVLETLFRQHAAARVESVLDLGCGTGNHALALAARGYDIVGVDRSSEMLRRAEAKAAATGSRAMFALGDVRDIRLWRTFDVVVILFAVLGYQTDNADVAAALRTARTHLRADGLLLFDVWYGPAVLRQRPTTRVKVLNTPGRRILRMAESEMDVTRQVCEVTFRLWELEGDRVVAETEERHPVRFFFRRELELLLEGADFTMLRLSSFPEVEREADEDSWSVLAAARALERGDE